MRLCPHCHTEVSAHQVADDDWIDHCIECGIIVEGETIDSEELELEEQRFHQWVSYIDADEQWIKENA